MSSGGAVKRARKKAPTKGQKDYMAKLRDPRWQKHKNEVLERDCYTCTWCRAGLNDGRNLQVHHGFYSREFESPWEYPKASLFTLCEKCHEQAEVLKRQVLERLGHLHPKYHHHIYNDLLAAVEALKEGEPFEPLDAPWAIKSTDAA